MAKHFKIPMPGSSSVVLVRWFWAKKVQHRVIHWACSSMVLVLSHWFMKWSLKMLTKIVCSFPFASVYLVLFKLAFECEFLFYWPRIWFSRKNSFSSISLNFGVATNVTFSKQEITDYNDTQLENFTNHHDWMPPFIVNISQKEGYVNDTDTDAPVFF